MTTNFAFKGLMCINKAGSKKKDVEDAVAAILTILLQYYTIIIRFRNASLAS